jgi:hypothetical protein
MKNMPHPVTITELDHGFTVRVGCKTLAFEQWETLLTELKAYATGQKTELIKRLEKEAADQRPEPNQWSLPDSFFETWIGTPQPEPAQPGQTVV